MLTLPTTRARAARGWSWRRFAAAFWPLPARPMLTAAATGVPPGRVACRQGRHVWYPLDDSVRSARTGFSSRFCRYCSASQRLAAGRRSRRVGLFRARAGGPSDSAATRPGRGHPLRRRRQRRTATTMARRVPPRSRRRSQRSSGRTAPRRASVCWPAAPRAQTARHRVRAPRAGEHRHPPRARRAAATPVVDTARSAPATAASVLAGATR
jgi:hypothetical protein